MIRRIRCGQNIFADSMVALFDSVPQLVNTISPGSELMTEALGEHVFENFLVNKRREWTEYKTYVTPFELERSLGTL